MAVPAVPAVPAVVVRSMRNGHAAARELGAQAKHEGSSERKTL